MLRRSIMTLYSGPLDIYSHQVRIVLAEKAVNVDILMVDDNHPSDTLLELNPYNTLPTLVDRDLVLYNSKVVMEYLDERFPHPPLLPVYPVARAESRLMMHRVENDWYEQLSAIASAPVRESHKLRTQFEQLLTAMAPLFERFTYFLSEEFSLVDCVIAPLLWRLSSIGIKLPPSNAKSILTYEKRLFMRDAFQASLTEDERELREPNDF